MSGKALVLRADAGKLPLPDESVDLVVCSPPYFALRSYRDGGEHFDGQLGSEPTPQEFLESLWAVMKEVWRVCKPTASVFVNLGDKRVAQAPGKDWNASAKVNNRDGYKQARADGYGRRDLTQVFGRLKSKMLLPHRFAIGCEDGLADPEGKGWIMRQDVVWQKLNGLPESVTDRCRDSHEYLFHLTKEGRYFAAVDEVREPQVDPERGRSGKSNGTTKQRASRDEGGFTAMGWQAGELAFNPLGKLPGSVWPLASEPLIISDEVKAHYGLPDHFAAFPTELVRRVILGWSPSGVCVECGEGRRPVVAKHQIPVKAGHIGGGRKESSNGRVDAYAEGKTRYNDGATITGYACPCGIPAPPTKPAVVLDIFGGTGTTAGVARALGRIGVSVDLSMDYSRLARWRIERSGHFTKVVNRTNRENQGDLFGVVA